MKIFVLVLMAALVLRADAVAQTQAEYRVERTTEPPTIDGVLDDVAWKRAPMPTGEWASYNPVRGDRMSDDFRTEVRVTYDDRNIYFAFHCFDNEPDRIRTNVARRDQAFSDDWIAISLDSAGTGQAAYHLFSNASASQMDAINTSASGEQFDADVVWFSAANKTADGYIVEVRIPLQTLRFTGGDDVRMGLVFFRKISRIGVSYAWPEMLPGQWVFDRPAHLVFADLKPRRLMELLPSVTYGVSQSRADATSWNDSDGNFNVGASGKFGVTSAITLDGTINPDFSQVESDAFQVTVNQRFPVFFSEKRPFFMEGMGLFNIAGTGGDGNMRTGVHTRRIVDPVFGAKLTGTLGKTTFGVLSASDDKPQDIGNRGAAVIGERNKFTTIGRATYALRRSDYAGAIFTQTQHAGRSNLVAGGDLSIRPSAPQQLSATVLTSQTSDDDAETSGSAAQVSYRYETRRFEVATQLEHYDRDFQMDTAFYNRTGFTAGWLYSEVNFFPFGTNSWLQRVAPFVWTKAGHDEVQDGNEHFVNTGVRFNFTRQGFLNITTSRGKEPWRGERYNVGRDISVFGEMQALRWLRVYANGDRGRAIFYDEVDPFQGRSSSAGFGFTLQPNQHLTQSVDVDFIRFDRASTGERIFSVDILNSKTTYQFDKHFLVRFLAQYDSSARRVLTDLLASYELVPGTVFHAGYGSLYERRLDNQGVFGPIDRGEQYLSVNRGLFLKASYLYRF